MKKEKQDTAIKRNKPKSAQIEKKKGGRIGIYRTAEELQVAVDNFLKTAEIPTIAGLTLALGFHSTATLYDYEHKKDSKFSSVIKGARLHITNFFEKRLGGRENCAGAMFWLKNHAGYRDNKPEDNPSATPIMIQVNFPTSPNGPSIAIDGKQVKV